MAIKEGGTEGHKGRKDGRIYIYICIYYTCRPRIWLMTPDRPARFSFSGMANGACGEGRKEGMQEHEGTKEGRTTNDGQDMEGTKEG
jgi:hypothetical protein